MLFKSNIKLLFKIIIIIILPTLGICKISSVNRRKVTDLALFEYLEHFKNEILVTETSVLTVIQSTSSLMTEYYMNELRSEILKPLNGFKIILEKVNRDFEHRYEYFNLLLIDSYESLRKIDPGPKSRIEDFSEYYLLVFYGNEENYKTELQNIFDYFWKLYIVNVAVLLEVVGRPIQLYTYYPFTQNGCHKPQSHLLNGEKSILNLTAAELFPNKFTNFHGCYLMAALWNVPPYLTLPRKGKNLADINGVEGHLLKVLAKELNFNVDFVIPPNNEQRGLVKYDGTLTGAIKMLDERIADLSLGCFRCTLERSTALTPSITFYQTMQVYTVLAIRQPWSSFEIILYPFDFYIWSISMGLTLALILSTYLLKYFHKTALKFIYGYTSCILINNSIIALTLGQPCYLQPQRNFARYVFVMWLMLTTVLRSTYQGALYDFLNSQKTTKPPDTTKELTERQYQLIVNMATGDSFSGVPVIRDKLMKMLIMNITDAGGFPILEENPTKRYVTGTPRDFLVNYVKTHDKYGLFHVVSDTIFSQHLCVYFTKHSYLVATFDRILQNLKGFGLIDHWAKAIFDDRFLEVAKERSGGVALTLSQLSSVFQICFYLYILAAVVLCIEIVWHRLEM